ncbi:MAG: 5,6-dimethylbenzimidazole synthase [Nitrospira sp.]|nr:5,6-dimethylbenzimidazole synthase [Nitrospira sp.]
MRPDISQVSGDFSAEEREAVYRAIFERRDVRKDFLPKPISEETLRRILLAAHHAGSVGYMQPWDFLVIRHAHLKQKVKNLFVQANDAAALQYQGKQAGLYRGLKLEGIQEAPINICVTCTRERGGPSVLGRATVPETDLYSTCCAIQNLWLAARAEGIGVGWVSILDYEALKHLLRIPLSVHIVAYLCVGYVSAFGQKPDLEKAGWRKRLPLDQLVHYELWGKRLQEPYEEL